MAARSLASETRAGLVAEAFWVCFVVALIFTDFRVFCFPFPEGTFRALFFPAIKFLSSINHKFEDQHAAF